jgi:hypothetical protein
MRIGCGQILASVEAAGTQLALPGREMRAEQEKIA